MRQQEILYRKIYSIYVSNHLKRRKKKSTQCLTIEHLLWTKQYIRSHVDGKLTNNWSRNGKFTFRVGNPDFKLRIVEKTEVLSVHSRQIDRSKYEHCEKKKNAIFISNSVNSFPFSFYKTIYTFQNFFLTVRIKRRSKGSIPINTLIQCVVLGKINVCVQCLYKNTFPSCRVTFILTDVVGKTCEYLVSKLFFFLLILFLPI